MGAPPSFLIRIAILSYDNDQHRFAPFISIKKYHVENGILSSESGDLTLAQFQECLRGAGITSPLPSQEWLDEYCLWNHDCQMPSSQEYSDEEYSNESHHAKNGLHHGHPIFSSVEALHSFNDHGKRLVELLRNELVLQSHSSSCSTNKRVVFPDVVINSTDTPESDQSFYCYNPKTQSNLIVQVQDFVPLYSSIQVGHACSWWHVKDCSYGCIIPIQQLPVSDELKSRLMIWRIHKAAGGVNWGKFLEHQDHCTLGTERKDLEEHILWELNFQIVGGKQDVGSAESLIKDCTKMTMNSVRASVQQ